MEALIRRRTTERVFNWVESLNARQIGWGILAQIEKGGITSFYMSGCRASNRTVHSTSRKCNVAIITGAGPKSPCRVKPAGPVIGPVNKVLPRPPLVASSSLLATRTRVFEPIITYSVSIHSFAAGWSGLAGWPPQHEALPLS